MTCPKCRAYMVGPIYQPALVVNGLNVCGARFIYKCTRCGWEHHQPSLAPEEVKP